MRKFWKGLGQSVPIMLGYVPIAIAYASMARAAGLDFWQTVSMSVFVYTGAGQMAATAMIAQGIGYFAIVMTVLIMNLRHIIMSTVIMEDLRKEILLKRCLLAFGVTDEVFAVYTLEDRPDQKAEALVCAGIMFGAWTSWNVGTLLGFMLTSFLPASLMASFGMALYAMFIALLLPSLKRLKKLWIPVAVSAIVCAVVTLFASSNIGLIIGSLVGAFVGTFTISEEELS